MRSFLAFVKKEVTEQLRSGKLTVLLCVFVILGVMNPAVAKLTPWLLDLFAESMAGTGITVTEVTVTATDSWLQFYKNVPMGLVVFLLLESGIFTREYETGTLVLTLTRGLPRYKVLLAKTSVLAALFSVLYWLCFGITYCYNAYFFDNAVAMSLGFSAFSFWLFGLLTVLLLVFFSVLARSGAWVLLGTGGVVLASYLVGMIPRVGRYLPTRLADGSALITGARMPGEYTVALIVAAILCAILLVAAFPLFNRKQL